MDAQVRAPCLIPPAARPSVMSALRLSEMESCSHYSNHSYVIDGDSLSVPGTAADSASAQQMVSSPSSVSVQCCLQAAQHHQRF